MNKKQLPPLLTRKDFESDAEFELYHSTKAGEWVSTDDLEAQKQVWRESAATTLEGKRSRISITIPEPNSARLKFMALR